MNKIIRKYLVYKARKLLNFFGWLKLSFKNQDKKPPIYENNKTHGLKLHIGPGEVNIQGWLNIDARDFDHIHIQSDQLNFNQFSDDSIQEIYLCHILEHLSFEELQQLLKLIHNKLKVGGIIRISVPDFDRIIAIYQAEENNIDKIKFILMGGQDYEFNFHKSVFTKNSLTKSLENLGFTSIINWDTKEDFGTNLGDWSSGEIKTRRGRMNISLNLKAKKSF